MTEFLSFLRKVAPTVAAAVGTPLAGGVVAALCALVGGEASGARSLSDVEKAFTSGSMTPDLMVKLKELDSTLQQQENELGFKYAELDFKDADSARARQVATGDSVNTILAIGTSIAFFLVCGFLLTGMGAIDSVLGGTVLGYMSSKAEQVYGYYFGSSKGSRAKDLLLGNSISSKEKV